ncbi:MAG: hypothetical protein DDT19_00368 [Syntrophomonadaceae bacterium]|nr:hypothetical protein [Bacillota bacterium]
MSKLPEYIGPAAFGLKMGVVLPDTDLKEMVVAALKKFLKMNCWMIMTLFA